MFLKKFFSVFFAIGILFSSSSVFASRFLIEDKETICNAVEALTKGRQSGYCQFIYSSPLGEPLLKEGLKYALELKKYTLAERLIGIFALFGIDINQVSELDYLVIKTGKKNLYEKMINAGYRISTPDSGNNLLYAAVKSENLEFVNEFLDKGFDPNALGAWDYDDFFDAWRNPLQYCIIKIQNISNENNCYGFGCPENRKRVENLVEIVKSLSSHGANDVYMGNRCEKSAADLLDELDPDDEGNCYIKFEYYDQEMVDFCRKIYTDLRNALNL